MFGRHKRTEVKSYDREKLEPAIRKSICTGEEVAGFLDRKSGRFSSVMLLKTSKDLDSFKAEWGIEGDLRIIY